MTSGPQLERSLLEAKERDELQTIAQAMALKTNARASKATLIGAILDAAGVDADAERHREEGRARRAASTNGGALDDDGSHDDGVAHDDATTRRRVIRGAPTRARRRGDHLASTESRPRPRPGVADAPGPRPPGQGGAALRPRQPTEQPAPPRA